MRRPRSIPLQIVIVVLLGLATTIAFAWMSAIYGTAAPAQVVQGYVSTDASHTDFFVDTRAFLTHVNWLTRSRSRSKLRPEKNTLDLDMVPSWSRLRISEDSDHHASVMTVGDAESEIAYGWPMRSMLAIFKLQVTTQPSMQVQYLTESGIALESVHFATQGGRATQPRALPLRIIPLGFTIDTALFATAWWLLLFAFPTTRRYIRTRRGTCLKCGYGPLASPDAVCPECGRVRGERPARRT